MTGLNNVNLRRQDTTQARNEDVGGVFKMMREREKERELDEILKIIKLIEMLSDSKEKVMYARSVACFFSYQPASARLSPAHHTSGDPAETGTAGAELKPVEARWSPRNASSRRA